MSDVRHEHGTPAQAARNLWRSRMPLTRRLGVAVRNGLRRLGPPPRDCCGNFGEPGC